MLRDAALCVIPDALSFIESSTQSELSDGIAATLALCLRISGTVGRTLLTVDDGCAVALVTAAHVSYILGP